MKNARMAICLLAGAFLLAGCTGAQFIQAPVQPPIGWVYAHYKAPLETNYTGADFGTKKGSAKIQYLQVPFWPRNIDVTWAEAAIRDAAEDGGITTVKGADYEFLQVLGMYAELSVHVYGD